MLTMELGINELDKVQGEFATLSGKYKHPKKMLDEIGVYMLSSIKRNFQDGGRPVAWEPSKRATADAIKGHNPKTLIDTRRLIKSITAESYPTYLELGTMVPYAAVHNYGIDKTVPVKAHVRVLKKVKGREAEKKIQVKAHTMHMKEAKREYMLIQDPEDWNVINKIAEDYLDIP